MNRSQHNESGKSSGDIQNKPEGTNEDVDKKVARILELIKNEGQSRKRGGKSTKRESELVGLIEEIHKEYQSLHVQYEKFKQEHGRSEHEERRKAHCLSPFGSNVSEYFSSDEIEAEIGELNAAIVNEEANKLKNLLDSTTKEKEALSSAYMEALRKIEEAESVIKDMRVKADASKMEVSSLSQKNHHFEDELISLKSELESLQDNKRHLEEKLDSQAMKTKEMKEDNKKLQARVLELGSMLKNKQKEIADLLKNLQDTENNRSYKVKELREENEKLQARVLEFELILKNKQKEASDLIKNLEDAENNGSCKAAELNDRVDELQLEMESMRARKSEVEEKMESLMKEQVVQEKEFKEKMEALINERVARERELDEKMEYFGNERGIQEKKFDDMRRDLQALASELEGKKNEVSDNSLEIERLKEEVAKRKEEEQRVSEQRILLAQQVKDLEQKVKSLTENRNELDEKLRVKAEVVDRIRQEKVGVEAKLRELEAEADANSTQITGLKIEIESLQQEMYSLEAQKSRLEINNRREEEETSRRMSLLESENAQLTSMIQDLQSKINEHGRPAGRLLSCKQAKNSPRSSKLEVSNVERKIEEVAEDCRMNLEDNIRILCQRILVLEQLHMETKESYKNSKDRFHDEYKGLQEQVSFYKNEMKKIMEASMNANSTIAELELLFRKSDEHGKSIFNRVSRASKEIQVMKDWFSKTNCKFDNGNVQDDTKVRDLEGSEEVKKLEKKVEELEWIVRERNNAVFELGEEKREAIRQLCILIDYQRSRCDYFKEIISKITVKRKN